MNHSSDTRGRLLWFTPKGIACLSAESLAAREESISHLLRGLQPTSWHRTPQQQRQASQRSQPQLPDKYKRISTTAHKLPTVAQTLGPEQPRTCTQSHHEQVMMPLVLSLWPLLHPQQPTYYFCDGAGQAVLSEFKMTKRPL